MLIFFRLLVIGLIIMTHTTSLLIIAPGQATFADLWFYYSLLFLVAPGLTISGAYYLFQAFKKKEPLRRLLTDLVLWVVSAVQNVSILAALRHWI